jgi:hypothetical protein
MRMNKPQPAQPGLAGKSGFMGRYAVNTIFTKMTRYIDRIWVAAMVFYHRVGDANGYMQFLENN